MLSYFHLIGEHLRSTDASSNAVLVVVLNKYIAFTFLFVAQDTVRTAASAGRLCEDERAESAKGDRWLPGGVQLLRTRAVPQPPRRLAALRTRAPRLRYASQRSIAPSTNLYILMYWAFTGIRCFARRHKRILPIAPLHFQCCALPQHEASELVRSHLRACVLESRTRLLTRSV